MRGTKSTTSAKARLPLASPLSTRFIQSSENTWGYLAIASCRLIPASIALGAVYMMIIDDVARTLTMAEIPLGILTGIVGAPVFVLLLRRSRSDWD